MTTKNSQKHIITKPFRNDEDFWRVRNLLIETYPITPTGFNWEVRRWDGWRFYNADSAWDPQWEQLVCLWETEDGELVGAVHPESTGDAYIELHPDYRHIEENMIAWAEDNLSTQIRDSKQRQLRILVFEYDTPRRLILEQRGYEKMSSGGVLRRLRFGNKLFPRPQIDEEYILHTVNPDDEEDCRKIADLLNAAFNRNFHNTGEYRTFTTHAPSFRRGMDLAALAKDGSFAAYTGVPYNESNRYGIFEPVCTHPNHQRKGLARSLMFEALHRLKKIGA
ncbi:MAG: GNAT family N-acetyltransferase, partial [candidate division Zixibacteria bacterium]|nr:GNAT family N-acetyltransferase [candidate division Zixibacteria bacterium]